MITTARAERPRLGSYMRMTLNAILNKMDDTAGLYLLGFLPANDYEIWAEIGSAGSHIPSALKVASTVADVLKVRESLAGSGNNYVIIVQANGLCHRITHSMSEADIDVQFRNLLAEQKVLYEASPEYATWRLQQEITRKINQTRIDNLLEELDQHILENQLGDWLESFTDINDNCNIVFDNAALADKLEAAGYIESEFVGKAAKDFVENEQFRWAVGQAIQMLRMPMPIHPALGRFFNPVKQVSV